MPSPSYGHSDHQVDLRARRGDCPGPRRTRTPVECLQVRGAAPRRACRVGPEDAPARGAGRARSTPEISASYTGEGTRLGARDAPGAPGVVDAPRAAAWMIHLDTDFLIRGLSRGSPRDPPPPARLGRPRRRARPAHRPAPARRPPPP